MSVPRSDLAQEMEAVYNEASGEYWIKYGQVELQAWIENHEEGDKPPVTEVMDAARHYAWERVAEEFAPRG